MPELRHAGFIGALVLMPDAGGFLRHLESCPDGGRQLDENIIRGVRAIVRWMRSSGEVEDVDELRIGVALSDAARRWRESRRERRSDAARLRDAVWRHLGEHPAESNYAIAKALLARFNTPARLERRTRPMCHAERRENDIRRLANRIAPFADEWRIGRDFGVAQADARCHVELA